MFDELIRELGRLDGMRVSVPMEADEDGYFDRACPSPDCAFEFKVHADDWRDRVRDEQFFCPFCGHGADSDEWWTPDQIRRAETAALNQVHNRLGHAMRRDAERWNRRQRRDSLIRITMDVKGASRHVTLPAAAAEPMRLRIACPACECRYAVIGAAFFCPACGHNAAGQVFERSVAGLRASLDTLGSVRAAIADPDTAETIIRHVIEKGLLDAVTLFQRYAEALFSRHPDPPRARRNVFQNLPAGSDLWRSAFGKGYDDHLEPHELASLTRWFQQRHLLAHRQGLVDAGYIARSGDTRYRPGQRIVVREAGVRVCLDLIVKLCGALRSDADAGSS